MKLLPLLAEVTAVTLAVDRSPSRPVRWGRSYHFPNPRDPGPPIKELKLADPFRARIRELDLDSRTPCMPDPFYFKRLEEVYLHNSGGFFVKNQDIWEDEAKLFFVCRSDLGGLVPWEEFKADRDLLIRRKPQPSHYWVLRMVKKLAAQKSKRKCRVVLSQMIFNRFAVSSSRVILGRVVHDVTAGTIAGEHNDS